LALHLSSSDLLPRKSDSEGSAEGRLPTNVHLRPVLRWTPQGVERVVLSREQQISVRVDFSGLRLRVLGLLGLLQSSLLLLHRVEVEESRTEAITLLFWRFTRLHAHSSKEAHGWLLLFHRLGRHSLLKRTHVEWITLLLGQSL